MSNAKTKGSKRGTRLGTQIRGELAQAYDQRGRGRADLMLHYSWKTQKDVVLSGQLQVLHFLDSQVDPEIADADYSPLSANTQLAGAAFAKLVHAVVKTRDREVVWRRLIDAEPDSDELAPQLREAIGKGPLQGIARLEVLTKDRLTANPMKVRNALRTVAWISAARAWPLADHKKTALDVIKRQRVATFDQIFSLGEGAERALYGAAVLELACSGVVRSDLHELPLTGMTLFHYRGE